MGVAEQATQKVSSASNQLASAVGGAIAAIGIQQVIHFAEGFQQLGDEVNVSRAQFAQLTQDMGGSAKVLDQLRISTNGVTDDMTLMNASSQLLTSGLVSNSSELSKMLGYLQDLKPAGQSLDDAIGALSATLQTGSTRGLNQFGVNVDFVKQRIDALTASGMSAQAAMKQAVFDGMAQSLERLGDAASADETPLKKLQVQIENLSQAAAGNFATGVEGIIGGIQGIAEGEGKLADFQAKVDLMLGLLPKLQAQSGELGGLFGPDPNSTQSFSEDQIVAAQQLVKWTGQLTDAWKGATQALSDYHQRQLDMARDAEANAAHLQQLAQMNAKFADLSGQFGNITAIEGRYTGLGMQASMPQYLDSRQYMEIQTITDRIITNAKSIKDQFGDLIPEDQKNALDAMSKSAKDLADQAKKAADAFENMKLSDILGTSGGGIAGEISDQVMEAAKQSGMSGDALKTLQDTLDLSSGRQTAASQSEQKFAAGLVGLPPDQVAKAISNWVASQQAAALAGLSGGQLAGSESYFAGLVGGGSGKQIKVQSGDSLYSLAGRYGGSANDYRSLLNSKGILPVGTQTLGGMGQIDPNFNPQNAVDEFIKSLGSMGQGGQDSTSLTDTTAQGKEDFAAMQTSSQGISDQFKLIGEQIGKISNMSFNWQINVSGLPDWLQKLFSSGGIDFGNQMAIATQGNGGIPPGSNGKHGGPIVGANPYM